MSEANRLQEWFEAADAEMALSYAENHAKARESKRIQQTGHAAEHAWGELLRRWLPPQYEIAYRRYILPEVNGARYHPRETDIVVLRPGYPRALRNKEEVLAAGVAAAFSVKLTLDAAGLKEAVEESAYIRRFIAPRLGTPRQESTPPFRYGVLGHAHNFGKNPRANLRSNFEAADLEHARHPRETLDLICVADLGVWSKLTSSYSPVWNEAERAKGNLVADRYAVTTTLIDNETSQSAAHPRPEGSITILPTASAIAIFISSLYSFLAQEDDVAEPFHRGLLGSEVSGSGFGYSRVWELEDVFHDGLLPHIPHRLVNGRDREWSMTY